MRKTVYSIQALRGIAAVMVVIFHAQALLVVYQDRFGLPQAALNAMPNLRVIGASGVDLFFVISGFVMAYITYGKRGNITYALPFLKRRAVRIIPVYWFYTSIMAGLLFFTPQLFSSARFDLIEVILSYLFIPYIPTVNPTAPILQVGWTLSYEMYFYLLVAAGLFLNQRRFALILGLFFCLSFFLSFIFHTDNAVFKLAGNPILFEFYAGFLCGVLYTSGFTFSRMLAPILLGAGVTGYVLWGAGLVIVPIGFFAVLIVAGSVFWERQTNTPGFPRFFISLGDSSYTLYLSHYLLIPALGKACVAIGFWNVLPPDAFIVIAVLFCVSIGNILYLLVEKPVIQRLSRSRLLLEESAENRQYSLSKA